MNNKTQSGERLSFYKLFSEKQYKVLIPIIQRDYAQGRKTKKEVRETFLDALHKYLIENKPNRDLDFVYGTLNKIEDVTNFIPLDGQQRLTTLFLLHWYLYQASNNTEKKEKFKNAIFKKEKSMFTYETRTSSSEFCDALMSNNINLDNLLVSDKDSKGSNKENNLSKTIKNCSWFYLSWEYDPTIQSMLTMLDAIHNKFIDKDIDKGEYFERLIDTDKPIITFLFLNLEDFKLTDDLYIKMNSRGKPLTPFENFKAKFEQYLKKIEYNGNLELKFGDIERKVTLKEYFSHNIDTKWANLFWKYRNLSIPEDTYDNELTNFIRVIFTNQYAKKVEISSNNKDDTLEYLLGTNVAKNSKDYSDTISFNKYEELGALSKDSVSYLVDAFDCFVNGNKEIEYHLSKNYKFYFDENKTFKNALKCNFESNHERLCFHAYVCYLIKNKDNKNGIEQWMRVIHNITHPENTIIDSASQIAAAIKSIDDLLPQSNNILAYLKQEDTNITLFSSWQTLEEKIKAYLITKHDNWKNKIELTEKHKYFNGQIGFVLEFAGIKDYYTANKNCNWNDKLDKEYFQKFSIYADKASKVFEESYDNRKNNKDYIFERAILTKGDYLTTASQSRKNLLSTNLVKNNIKRDHSWKRLLRISDEDKWKDKRLLVQQVFDDGRFNKDDLENSLKEICKDKTETWRDYFIACPDLIKYCEQGFIRFENENKILLYGESQSNHKHVEMYSYYLWKTIIEPNKESFMPFKNIYYYSVKSIDDEASIILDEFCHKRIYYKIIILYDESYKIIFSKSKGKNNQNEYESDIKNILEKLNFEWVDNNGYEYDYEDRVNALKVILKNLCKQLNDLT